LPAVTDRQKQLRAFIKRRHPDYQDKCAHWDFLDATYEGGREWFCNNVFRYIKEGDKEYEDRVKRAYRFNHTREVVDLVQKYIFKSAIVRANDAPKEIKDFWKNATLSGLSIQEFMKLVGTETSKKGRGYLVVDTNAKPNVVSVADAKAAKVRVYAYYIRPQDALDMGFDEDGVLQWILLRERVRDDKDPITSSGAIDIQYRLWTTTFHQLFTVQQGKSGKVEDLKVTEHPPVGHTVGEVPVLPVDHVISEDKYSAPGLIDDIAYLDRACANYCSNLDAIIQDQTFSQLVMPAQGLMPGTDKYDALVEMGTKRIFAYDGEGGAKPEYISPDVKQAQLIITVINKIITEIYHTVGMAGERTKQDNAMGIDNSSGVAKAYDFERMNSLLTSKADALENAENKLADLVLKWNGQPKGLEGLDREDSELVKYPDTFDVRTLFDEFTIAERLALVDAPKSLRQEQMKQVIEKLFPRLASDLKSTMLEDVANWPMTIADKLTVTATMGGSGQPTKFPASASVSTGGSSMPATPAPKATPEKRQGQVTKDTKSKTKK
jgi:hypothetical protein